MKNISLTACRRRPLRYEYAQGRRWNAICHPDYRSRLRCRDGSTSGVDLCIQRVVRPQGAVLGKKLLLHGHSAEHRGSDTQSLQRRESNVPRNAGSSIFYEWGCETKSGQCHDCRFNATMSAGGQCHSDNRGTPYTWSCIPETDIHHNVRCEAFPNDNCSGTPTSVTYDFGNENSGFCVACNRSGSEKLVLNQCSKLVCLNCRPRDPASTYDLLTCEKKGGTGSQYCTCGPSLPTLPQPQRFSPRHVSGIGDEHGGNYVVGNAH